MTTPSTPQTPGQWLDRLLTIPGTLSEVRLTMSAVASALAGMATQVDAIDARTTTIDERTREIITMNEAMREALTGLAAGVNEAVGDIEALLDRVEAGDTDAVAEIRSQTAKLRNAVPDVTPTPNPTPAQPIPTPDADGEPPVNPPSPAAPAAPTT